MFLMPTANVWKIYDAKTGPTLLVQFTASKIEFFKTIVATNIHTNIANANKNLCIYVCNVLEQIYFLGIR